MLPLKYLNVLEIDQGLLAHTPKGDEGPPPKKKNNRENLKLGLKFTVRLNNFGASGSILMTLFQTTCHEAGVINWVQFLEGPPPKNRPKFSRFLTTFDFDREYLRNGSIYRK